MAEKNHVSWWHWFHRWSKWGEPLAGTDSYQRPGTWQRRNCAVCNLTQTKRV